MKSTLLHRLCPSARSAWLTALTLVAALTVSAQPALPLYEPFDYDNNERLGGATSGVNWTWGNSTGTGSTLVSNQATLSYAGMPAGTGRGLWFTSTTPSSGRNRGRPFLPVALSATTQTVYYSFLLNVQSPPGGLKQIFALSASTNSLSTAMTVFLTPDGRLALGKNSSTAATITNATALPTDTTHLVVVRLRWVTGSSNDELALWLNPGSLGVGEGSVPPATITTTSGSDASTIGSLAVVHQPTPTPPGDFYVDEVRIGLTWADVTPTGCPPGTAYNVTGGGTLCAGDPGVSVGLDGSETGVDYQLKVNGVDVGAPVAGTGSALNFGPQTIGGTYTVIGSNTTTTCVGPMNGSAVVTVLAAPSISFQPTPQTAPLGGSASFTVVASGAGLSYQWRRDGTNLSNGGPISGANTATLTINPVALSDAATSADGYDVVVSGTCSPSVTSDRVALTVTVPKNLTWLGDGSANLWDTTSANWTGDATTFANGDNVTFNNTGSTAPPVDIVGVVSPNLITVNASVDYTIGTTTTGSIGGSGSLTKSGSGKLTLATVNSFTGKTTVNGGTVSVATASHLGAAPPVFTADHLTLNGGTIEYTVTGSINANRGTTLGASGGTFSIPAGVTFTNTPVTTGPGSLTKTGDGTLALNVANTYAGGTVLSNGTLLFNNVNSLGTGPLTLAGGTLAPIGSLDAVTNDIVLAADSVITGGNIAPRFNGALGGSAGTLTFNGTAATFAPRVQGAFSFNRPIDLANANTSMRCYNIGTTQVFNGVISGPGTVHRRTATGGLQGTSIFNAANTFSGGFTLTEGYVGLGSSTTGDPITSGPLGTGTLTLGDSGNSALSVRGLFAAGGPRSLGNPIVFSTAALVQTNVFTGSHGLTFTGPVTLNTNRLFVVDNTGVTTFAGPIGNGAASSGLTKQGPGVLRLNGTNTYTGDTVVDAGTLSGTGILAGDVVVNSGGNLAPGAATRGTLTVNGDITLGGNFTARVSAGGSPANDQLAGATSITYGGTLTIVNEGPALNASHTFKLFDATAYSGSFASISPATPGPGLAWNTGTLTTDGTLRISAAGGPDPTPTNIVSSVSGTTLTLSWPASHTGWTLQTQTNPLSTGLITTGAWFAVPGSTSTNQVQFTIDKSNPAVFFRLYLP